MRAEHEQSECDPRVLSDYLEQRLSADEEAAVEAHLDACDSCRQRICDSAAEADWWDHAGRFLRPDAWDDQVPSTGGFECGQGSHDADMIVRQIQEWLDAAEDPQYLGRFGGYEILGVIGYGGMGIVLKGFEPCLNRYVAIKVLSPALAASGAARKRFRREATAAAAVLHENVIAIYRVAECRGLPYLVMPYAGGVSLQQRIDAEGPLPLAAMLRISRQIAAGLAAAHAQGLVHRDIKPANILLERGVERVAITDFGLARAADDGSLTRTGFIAGTPQYMSPEQARGESVDARSDLFSLGSVMYAMAAGRPPFRAETSYGILRRITDSQPRPLREVNPDIPPWLEALIGGLHAKSPGERIGSAEELTERLQQCLAHVQQPTVSPLPEALCPAAPWWRRGWPMAIGSGLLAVALCLAAAPVALLPPMRVDSVPPAAGALNKDVVSESPFPTGRRDQQNQSTHESDWDAAAREIRELDTRAQRLSAEVDELWKPLPPPHPIPDPEAAR